MLIHGASSDLSMTFVLLFLTFPSVSVVIDGFPFIHNIAICKRSVKFENSSAFPPDCKHS